MEGPHPGCARVAEGTIRERILKGINENSQEISEGAVAEGTIRERILKGRDSSCACSQLQGCRGDDPKEDTETRYVVYYKIVRSERQY
jgi:hypothetical protein